MKYFIALLIAGGLYFVCFRTAPVAPVAKAITEPRVTTNATAAGSPQQSNVLKRPLDRTHEVLSQARKNNAENAF